MPDRVQSTPPPNAFHPAFLELFQTNDEPPGAAEAVHSGPWTVLHAPKDRHVVMRPFEQVGTDTPEGDFEHAGAALLFASILPFIGREPVFKMDPESDPRGFAILELWGEQSYKPVGHVRTFDEDIVWAMNVAASIVRSPVCLAQLLLAAGPEACTIAGRLLWESSRRWQLQ